MHGGLSLLCTCGSHAVLSPHMGAHAWLAACASSLRRLSEGCTPFWTALLSKVLGCMPVGAPFLEQPGTPLWATLGFQQIAQTHPKPDTAQETEAEGQAPLLGLRQQSFPQPRRASERHASPGKDRLRLPPQSPPGIVQEVAGLAPIVSSRARGPRPDALRPSPGPADTSAPHPDRGLRAAIKFASSSPSLDHGSLMAAAVLGGDQPSSPTPARHAQRLGTRQHNLRLLVRPSDAARARRPRSCATVLSPMV